MKTIYSLFLLLFFSCSVLAQEALSGKVLDAETQAPVTYVNIGVKGQAKGTVSDDAGAFLLENISEKETIVFSAIGYETLEKNAKDLLQKKEVNLIPQAYEIPSVEIKASRFDGEEKIFGVKNETRGLAIGFGNPQLGTQIGSLIYIDRPTLIKSANFVLNHAKGDSLLFRINIYQYENGVVGDPLLTQNIYLKEKQRKGNFSIDLTAYDLILDSSVMLSLEWLRNFDEIGNKDITFDTKRGKKLKGIYYKVSNTTDFEKLPSKPRLKPCIYFIGKQAKGK